MEDKQSVWHKNLNLFFVYGIIFAFGLITVSIMMTIINNKVEELNANYLLEQSK